MTSFKNTIYRHRADAAMSIMVFIWGFHFIVLKDGLETLPPLAYNALRFLIGLPVMIGMVLHNPDLLKLSRRDLAVVVLLAMTGSVLFQALQLMGLQRTTATNSSLFVATMPAWTALLCILAGSVALHRRLVTGVAITLAGVALVILGKSSSGLSLTSDDLLGSGMILVAAVALGATNMLKEPLVNRLGSMRVAVWSYWATVAGLVVLAAPELITLSGDHLVQTLPNLLYSGLLAGTGGALSLTYAIGVLGPTRASSYFNFPPVVAALGGILLLGEPFTLPLLIGGCLTLLGVITVRRNTFIRLPAVEATRESCHELQPESVHTIAR
ncbi:MAG: DMT family transporter [Anaerolineae bacterium]|nr:DMT family transporter [Anaerolineae bacterium]